AVDVGGNPKALSAIGCRVPAVEPAGWRHSAGMGRQSWPPAGVPANRASVAGAGAKVADWRAGDASFNSISAEAAGHRRLHGFDDALRQSRVAADAQYGPDSSRGRISRDLRFA